MLQFMRIWASEFTTRYLLVTETVNMLVILHVKRLSKIIFQVFGQKFTDIVGQTDLSNIYFFLYKH